MSLRKFALPLILVGTFSAASVAQNVPAHPIQMLLFYLGAKRGIDKTCAIAHREARVAARTRVLFGQLFLPVPQVRSHWPMKKCPFLHPNLVRRAPDTKAKAFAAWLVSRYEKP